MNRYKRFRWAPFYLLVPLAGALLFLDEVIPMPSAWRMITLMAIAVLIGVLAARWIERHPRLTADERLRTHLFSITFCSWPLFQAPLAAAEDVDISGDEGLSEARVSSGS